MSGSIKFLDMKASALEVLHSNAAIVHIRVQRHGAFFLEGGGAPQW